MTRLAPIDLTLALLIGAAIATGNPASGDFGIAAIVLPALVAGIIAAVTGAREAAGARALAALRWTGAIYIAFVFLWYEQYKLTGAEGSVILFTTLTDWLGFHGHESVMRIGVGSAEVFASLLVLIPRTQGLGALGAVALMSGAIFFHLVSPLGVDPYNDGAFLFKEACSVWVSGWVVAWWQRNQLAALARRFI
jgi:hypothetical protein